MGIDKQSKSCFVSQEELLKQKEYAALAGSVLSSRFMDKPLAFVHTYGCQGNVSDGERIKGILETIGYGFTDNVEDADLIIVMDGGRITHSGTHEELLKSSDIYSEIYQQQTKGGDEE